MSTSIDEGDENRVVTRQLQRPVPFFFSFVSESTSESTKKNLTCSRVNAALSMTAVVQWKC
jgi:hypothetical protein